MGIFNTIGNRVKSTGNQISGRARDTGEQLKLNNEIQTMNRQLEVQYQKLGEMYYNWVRSNKEGEPDFSLVCSDIDSLKVRIHEKEERISSIRAQVVCPSCGKMIPPDMKFCPFCGTPVSDEEKQKEAERKAEEARKAAEALRQRNSVEEDSEQRDSAIVGLCTNCGAPLEPGAKFCTACGHPVELIRQEETDTQEGAQKVTGTDSEDAEAAALYCTNCGARLEPGSRFCDICGHPVE